MISYIQELVDIINKHISKSEFKDMLSVTETDINEKSITNKESFIGWEFHVQNINGRKLIVSNDKFVNFFSNLSSTRKYDYGAMYHFIPFKYALEILKNNKIQLTELSSLTEVDSSEYFEFFHRYNYLDIYKPEEIKSARKMIFIFCFTKDFRIEKFWDKNKNIDNKEKKLICIRFNFEHFYDEKIGLFDLGDVVYDYGYKFDFINDIQRELKDKFGKYLYWGGFNRFSRFYKRDIYDWESEIRLVFDFDESDRLQKKFSGNSILGGVKIPEIDLNNYLSPEFNNLQNRRFIRLKLRNPFFKLKISEIICPINMLDEQIEKIKSCNKDDNIKIWRMR